jgi:Concanavalin A-like lectin/glucanases superfamily
MDAVTIIISLLVAIGVVVGAYFIFSSPAVSTNSTTIAGSTEDGRTTFKSKKGLPRSNNQDQGMTFSYTTWIRIDDFAYRYGQQKVIFTKGPEDLTSMCPALLIDGNTNTLLLKIDTFGGTDIVPISNIPAKKWIHFAVAVDQDSVDIYINGSLYIHHTLTQLPKQNNSVVTTGAGGGFAGKIANLEYYPYFLTPDVVKTAMASTPQPSPEDKVEILPPYFDMSWWTSKR